MQADTVGRALRIIDDVRDEVERLTFEPGKAALPELSFEAAKASTALGKALTKRISQLDDHPLPPALHLTLQIASEYARIWSVRESWYWTVFDPLGGMFSMFAPTAYCGGYAIGSIARQLQHLALNRESDRQRYLAGVHDLGDIIDQLTERTRGQAERGIFLPRLQAEASIGLLERLAEDQPKALIVGADRLTDEAGFKAEAERVALDRIGGGLKRFRAQLDADYLASAGDKVGLMHFPDGAEIYAELVKFHTSTSLTAREVHEIGLERLSRIREQMKRARAQARFDGSDADFRNQLDRLPEWREGTPEGIQAHFERHIDRIRPYVDEHFSQQEDVTFGVRPLPDALTETMTFGYYDGPTAERRHGDYVFNARNLAKAGLYNLGALTYHELVPGHHLHLSSQRENLALPALRKASYPTAFTEGWAEYALTFSEELGLFESPEERFGRCVSDAFLTCRLVVDTGMNALGWSLEKARDYMRENSFFGEAEICSETLRYSCDIPGQALAYKIGDSELMRMRAKMQAALGDGFKPKFFHDAVLGGGAMPLHLLDRELARITAEAQ